MFNPLEYLFGVFTGGYTQPVTCGGLFDSNNYFDNFGYENLSTRDYSQSSIYSPIFSTLNFDTSYYSSTLPVFSTLTARKSSRNNSSSNNPFKSYSFNTNPKYSSLTAAGYNATLAARLAQDVASNARRKSIGYCARYVSDSLERLGLLTKRGDAWQLKNILRKNPHFKEVDVSSVDVRKLPAGCILVYDRRAAGYSSEHGHVEVTLGNGKAASDFINRNIRVTPNMSVFVPVSA